MAEAMLKMSSGVSFDIFVNLFVFQGGVPFELTYQTNLPEGVQTAHVLFEKTTFVEVKKLYGDCLSGRKIPGMYIYKVKSQF